MLYAQFDKERACYMHKTCMFYTTQEIKYVMNMMVQIRNAQWMYINDYRHFYNVVTAFESLSYSESSLFTALACQISLTFLMILNLETSSHSNNHETQ